jgi:hypothetical protein
MNNMKFYNSKGEIHTVKLSKAKSRTEALKEATKAGYPLINRPKVVPKVIEVTL